jgi:hypothetical protein
MSDRSDIHAPSGAALGNHIVVLDPHRGPQPLVMNLDDEESLLSLSLVDAEPLV